MLVYINYNRYREVLGYYFVEVGLWGRLEGFREGLGWWFFINEYRNILVF